MSLHQFESFLNQIAYIVIVFLTIVDSITKVFVPMSEKVHHGQNLAVVGYERLCYGV